MKIMNISIFLPSLIVESSANKKNLFFYSKKKAQALLNSTAAKSIPLTLLLSGSEGGVGRVQKKGNLQDRSVER